MHEILHALGKDATHEQRLDRLNALLAPVEIAIESVESEPKLPVVLILGPPRAGTTLVSQLLSSSGAFGYISNFVARLWATPALGLLMESSVFLEHGNTSSSFQSKHGRTDGWWEPHEFGRFWSRWFDFGQETHWLDEPMRQRVNRDGLRRAVGAMEAVCAKPMSFKNNTWFTFQADLLAAIFPSGVFVACQRDAFYVAQSLWLHRLSLHGDPSIWWSVRPPDYVDILQLPPIEQVARQAVSIERAMGKSLARVHPSRVVSAPYKQVTEDPRGLVASIAQAVKQAGAAIEIDVEQMPRRFETTNTIRVDATTADLLRRAVDKWRTNYQV